MSIYKGRLKSKKQHAQPVSSQNTSSQQPPRPLSRGRELERGQQAARLVFGWLGCWERLPPFGECPLPNPPPRGRERVAADFRRCRPSEKECPKYQRQKFFRQPLSQGRWNKCRKRFFRRPLNPSVGCVPQGTHAVEWGYRENGERVRAYRAHPTYGLRLAKNVFATDGLVKSTFLDNLSNRIRFSTQSTLAQFFTY